MFKAQVEHAPYFYLQVRDGLEVEVEAWLRRKFGSSLRDIEIMEREDLDLKNHLSGLRRRLAKLIFWNVDQLMTVRRELFPIINRNRRRQDGAAAYAALGQHAGDGAGTSAGPGAQQASLKAGKERLQEGVDAIEEMREHDVPYHVRFAIDTDVRAGHWFTVRATSGKVTLERRADLLQRAEPRICAFDIETTKLPLQFPNAEYDQVFMISYMLDKKGFLIINREVVSEDIRDFEYSPKPEFEGPFTVINCANEAATLRAWFDHMRAVQPGIYVTYNGDYFDWPFIETRAGKHGLDMATELGFRCDRRSGECLSRSAVHMDCLHWVNRDSYLPQGSRGLKSVTKYKLGYDPVEVDPEDMVRLAAERPQAMASYSVSDAVATYYLYMTYIHPFIFSLSTIIPMPPDEVLRKGSGTLCEALLMVQAAAANIVAPNKHSSATERMHRGHLLESETYIGGKVEALESGVFRADLPCRFKCHADSYQRLIDKLDGDLKYALEHEAKWNVDDVENYDAVRSEIAAKLEDLRDRPVREEPPLIYHLDVAAMYPNIILTNRLQPSAVVMDEDCAACDFNLPGKTCLREMEWVWRGETYAATRAEYLAIKAQLQSEGFPSSLPGGQTRVWSDLSGEERAKLLKERLKKYCQRVYKRVLDKPVTEKRMAGICQRENSFYYDTVRAFRDRRYEYKGLNKVWKGRLEDARTSGNAVKIAEAADMCVLYDSLQLAHKCILNSFYGYVMRKGARWYSMEMAGVVTHTGANIIKRANEVISQLGRPLELDTDGIWCALPKSFPEEFKVGCTIHFFLQRQNDGMLHILWTLCLAQKPISRTPSAFFCGFETYLFSVAHVQFLNKANGKTFKLSYPCAMLNVMVAEHNTNDQFATLVDPARRRYETSSEMTIEFEVDGPYLAMVLPASKEEGKLIKKRYAVFNFDGSLAELKGFELKRRGELKLIKVFQGEVFDQFLLGSTLEECYGAVAAIANRWLDLLDTRGVDLTDAELVDLISETSVMSKGLDEYGGRKSCPITCATRLAQFLGDERVRDKGLVSHYVIAAHPKGQPTSERAIPVAIFSTEPSIARTYLRRWCGGDVSKGGDTSQAPDVRDIVDWDYYRERLGSAIQKIITIPAAMQRVPNPVPRVRHPDWLHKKVAEKDDTHKQTKLDTLFAAVGAKKRARQAVAIDLEDLGDGGRLRGNAGNRELLADDVGIVTTMTVADRDHYGTRDVSSALPVTGNDENLAPDGPNNNAAHVPTPSRQENFFGWLESMKAVWKGAAVERTRRREAAGLEARRQRPRLGGAVAVIGSGVDAMFAQQGEAAAEAVWQLVSLAPSSEPGVYKAWAVINGRMNAVPLRVPRTFYIDTVLSPEHPALAHLANLGLITPVKRTLPGGAEPHLTYEVTMPEGQYRASLQALEAALSHPGVRGVYEARVAPQWSAALTTGCTAAVAPSASRRTLGAGFDLGELRQALVAHSGYFGSESSSAPALRHMALHHSHDPARGRALFVLHDPVDGTCRTWIVNPARGGAKEVTSAAVERAWREARDTLVATTTIHTTTLPDRFEVSYVRSTEVALKNLQRILARLRDRARGPMVLLVNAPDAGALAHALPALGDLPWATMSSTDEDKAAYPALGWQLPAARVAARRLIAAGNWLSARLDAARYAHLPLASMGSDWVLDAFDALFARQLKDASHLLWSSDPSQPDVGGRPRDVADALLLRQGQGRVELAWPGAYRCVCLEVRINHLAVCAVLEAVTLSEMEGAALGEDGAGCGPAFRVFRGLAQTLMEDATRRSNICADTLLRHMYRWLCSPSSRLYDPALKVTVQGLMRKLLLQLVAELRRLGATVVYADTSSLILATGRHALGSALSYADYVLGTLRKRELFQWMSLVPSRAWHTLLFADRYNYLGVVAQLPEAVAVAMSQAPGSLVEGGGQALDAAADELSVSAAAIRAPQFDCVLNVAEYLPAAIRDAFVSAIGEFVWLPWSEAVRAAVRRAETAAAAGEGGDDSDPNSGNGADGELSGLLAAQTAWLKTALPGPMTEKLLRVVKYMALHMGAHDGRPDHEFPKLAGSYLTAEELGTPALAFGRSVCHMYGLDAEVSGPVTVLRRQLLKLIHVKEFGPDAVWRDPCKRLVLPDVVCSSCQDCQDLDLCRDPGIQARDWRCGVCGAPRDAGVLEARLASTLRALGESHMLQDLKCIKCGTAAADHLQRQCDVCGGKLRAGVPLQVMKQQISVFRSVAEYQEMPVLLDLTEWYMKE